jgi:hypothetical protein
MPGRRFETRLGLRLAAVAFLVVLGSGCHSDLAGQRTEDRRAEAQKLDVMARDLLGRVQGLEIVRRSLLWDSLTMGEPARMEALLPITAEHVSRKRLFELRRLENSSRLAPEKRRALRYLRAHLTWLYVLRGAARRSDRIVQTAVGASIKLDPNQPPIRLVDLRAVVTGTERAARPKILARGAPTLRRLDRQVNAYHHDLRQQAARLGTTPFELHEELEERDTRQLLAAAVAGNKRSDKLFRFAWRSMVPEDRPTRLSDLRFFEEGGEHLSTLSERQLMPALEHLLDGLGLQLRSTSRQAVRVSQNGAVSTVVAIHPPNDVRLLHRPESGLMSYTRLFEAAGRAICRARNREQHWVFQALGPQLGARAFGYLLGLVWLERDWWGRYRGLENGPRLGDAQLDDLIRTRIFVALVRLRVQGVVVPILRVVLRGGPGRTYEGVWPGPRKGTPSAPRIFSRLMDWQLGLQLSADERLSYVEELDLPLEEELDLRAYTLAHMLLELMREKHGARWFNKPEVGKLLVSKLCARGSRPTMRELVAEFDFERPELDMDAPWRNLQAAWEALHE